MDIETIFKGISERANKISPLSASLKFMLDEDAIYIDGTGDSNIVSMEDKDADCTVKVSKTTFESIVSGKMNPMMAFMSGKIKVSGDMGVAMKLQSLLGD